MKTLTYNSIMNIHLKIEAKKVFIPYVPQIKDINQWNRRQTINYFYSIYEDLFINCGTYYCKKLSKRARRNLI